MNYTVITLGLICCISSFFHHFSLKIKSNIKPNKSFRPTFVSNLSRPCTREWIFILFLGETCWLSQENKTPALYSNNMSPGLDLKTHRRGLRGGNTSAVGLLFGSFTSHFTLQLFWPEPQKLNQLSAYTSPRVCAVSL